MLEKFEAYCKPRINISFERYCFNHCVKKPGKTYDQYHIALRQLAEGCDFATIIPDEILRDHLYQSLGTTAPRIKTYTWNTDEICQAAKSMVAQLKVVEDSPSSLMSAAKSDSDQQQAPTRMAAILENAGTVDIDIIFCKRELCRAYGKTCN